jgi:hypothetical protein
MAIKELSMHLALNEGAFQASTRESCFQLLLSSNVNTQIMLTSYCEMICRQQLNGKKYAQLADLGSLNLFVLTSGKVYWDGSKEQITDKREALHSMIFQSQQAFGCDNQMTPIRTGLDNWITIWQIYLERNSVLRRHQPRPTDHEDLGTTWQRIGFYHSADEYWMLAKLMVDRVAMNSQLEGDRMLDGDSITIDAPTKEELLGKYDETSMRQVNELIADFQRILT